MVKVSFMFRPGGLLPARAICWLLLFSAGLCRVDAFVANLEAFAAPEESVFLRWRILTDDELGFAIERARGGEAFAPVVTTPPGTGNFTDTGLLPATAYTYRVRALVEDRELPWRDVEVTTLPDWETPQAKPRSFEVRDRMVSFGLQGSGVTAFIEQSNDLSAWTTIGNAFFLDTFSENERQIPLGEAPMFFRVRTEAFERPSGIGLNRPFETPPQPDGEIWDVTDFGATPISTTNDDAIGIKVALSLAESGDTVLIPEGVYTIRQVLEIPSGVTLKGAGMELTELVTESIDRAIMIAPEAHDIRLQDLAITHLGDEEELLYGVYVGSSRQGRNSYRIVIDSLRIERFSKHAVSLRDCHHVLVQDCLLRNATNLGGGGHGYGVALNYPTNHNNWVRHNEIGPLIRHGVLIQYEAHNNLVEHNLAVENTEDAYDLHGEDEYANELRFNIARDGDRDGFGVGNTGSTHDRSGPNNWIHHNTVENSLAGVEIIQASDIVYIDHNTFSGNEYGIRVHNLGGNQLYLRGNRIEGNDVGVLLNSTRWVWLLHNHISGSTEFGVEILSGVSDLVDEGNVFKDNAADYAP